jgi:hypothetical protein
MINRYYFVENIFHMFNFLNVYIYMLKKTQDVVSIIKKLLAKQFIYDQNF